MNITKIADIAGMEGGALIEKMTVTVKSAFDPIQKTSEYGPYTVQNAVLEDDTGTIKCAFFDANINAKNFIGQQITMLSSGGKGINTLDYNNKKTGSVERQIKASKYTVIDEVTGGQSGPVHAPNQTQSSETGTDLAKVTRVGKVSFVEDAEVKRASIERQKALEMAVTWLPQGVLADVISTAEKFYAFIALGPRPSDPEKTSPVSPQEAGEASGEVL